MVFINHEAGSESLLLLHVLGRAIGIQVICGTTQAASGTGTKLNGHIFYDEPAEEFNFNNRIWFSVLENNFGVLGRTSLYYGIQSHNLELAANQTMISSRR